MKNVFFWIIYFLNVGLSEYSQKQTRDRQKLLDEIVPLQKEPSISDVHFFLSTWSIHFLYIKNNINQVKKHLTLEPKGWGTHTD